MIKKLEKLKKWFGIGTKTAEQVAASARALLTVASDNLAQVLEDADANGLPDVAERAARFAGQIVGALEIVHGHSSGSGIDKINEAMQEVMAASRKGIIVWNLAKPFIEAAVNLLPRKRIEVEKNNPKIVSDVVEVGLAHEVARLKGLINDIDYLESRLAVLKACE